MEATRTLLIAGGLVLTFGCATTTTSEPAPTHYWESTVTRTTYDKDNEACQPGSSAQTAAEFDADSLDFQSYRECMISKGYTLRTY